MGDLSNAEEQEFFTLLPMIAAQDRAELTHLFDAAALAGMGLPAEIPPASLKTKVLAAISKKQKAPAPEMPGLHFVYNDDGTGWQPLPVAGAFVKPLSLDPAKPYAVVLGKLSPGASYPPHKHTGPEDVYVVSGDLTIGSTRLEAGDFHHADPGSEHGINFSEHGCMVLVVLTIQDLQAQYAAAGAMAS